MLFHVLKIKPLFGDFVIQYRSSMMVYAFYVFDVGFTFNVDSIY